MGFAPFCDMPMNKETNLCFYHEIISEKCPRKKITKSTFLEARSNFG